MCQTIGGGPGDPAVSRYAWKGGKGTLKGWPSILLCLTGGTGGDTKCLDAFQEVCEMLKVNIVEITLFSRLLR